MDKIREYDVGRESLQPSSSLKKEEENGFSSKFPFIANNCERLKDSNTFLAKGTVTFQDTTIGIRKIEVGKRDVRKPEKVILMVGQTGSGKSTFINRMLNHVVGVDWNSNCRLKLIEELDTSFNQAISQTNYVTAYTINHVPGFEIPYTLTIIDTPGFEATEGIKRDKQTTEQLRALFTKRGPRGIDRLDVVGFVVQSSKSRLTVAQKYIYDSVLSLFGKDIVDNIFVLFTFADGGRPEALSSLEAAHIPFNSYFTFNNVSMYENKGNSMLGQIYWNMGKSSFQSFLNKVGTTEPKSLLLTREVLNERKQLEKVLLVVERNIGLNSETLEQLRREKTTLTFHRKELEEDKEFTYEAMEQYVKEEPAKSGHSTINCTKCNITCFEVPADGMVDDLIQNVCISCPGKCRASQHRCEQRHFVFKSRLVLKTSQDLCKAYQPRRGKKSNSEQMIQECANRIAEVHDETLLFVNKARICVARLEEIAIKPNSLQSTEDYIILLIEDTKMYGSDVTSHMSTLLQLKKQVKMRKAILEDKIDPVADNNMMHEVIGEKDEEGKFVGVVTKLYKSSLLFEKSLREKNIPRSAADVECAIGSYVKQKPYLKPIERETKWKNVIDMYSCRLEAGGNPKVYTPKLKKTCEDGLMKFEIGEKNVGDANPERFIMLFGEKGSDKTALINALFNFILGMEWSDEIRFKLIGEEEAEAKYLASYTIHHQPWFKIPFTVTVIDTPGYGGQRGNKEVTNQVATFLSTIGPFGLDRLDAVGFVIKSTESRLSPSQKYIFDSIPGLFGKDVARNIFMMLTFADTGNPAIINAIQESSVPYQKCFKFNNSTLYSSKSARGEIFWNIGAESFDTFIRELHDVEQISLTLTKRVIKTQRYIDAVSETLPNRLEFLLGKVETLDNAEHVLRQHQSEIERNNDFMYTEQIREWVREEKPKGQNITNCTRCQYTCHQDCRVEFWNFKYICSSMNWLGNCKICPGECSWRLHNNEDYIWKYEVRQVKKERTDLRVGYERARVNKLSTEEMIVQFNKEIEDLMKEILKMVEEAQTKNDELKEISAGSKTFPIVEQIDRLIEREKLQKCKGWEKGIDHLEKLMKQVKEIQNK